MNYADKWALVTGASAGLGAGFARSLAAKGANVALVARREDRLQALAREIAQTHRVRTIVAAADLSSPDAPETIFNRLEAEDGRVDILVNNAGFGLPGVFLDADWSEHRAWLELMVTSYAHLARLALPGMRERGWGRIIQVASLAGIAPGTAGHTMYGASKAFLIAFSQSLAAESRDDGVKVSAVCPGFTYTEFHDVNNTRSLVSQLPKYMFMSAEPVIEGAIRAVENDHTVYVPGAWNKFVAWLTRFLPMPLSEELAMRQSRRFRRQNPA